VNLDDLDRRLLDRIQRDFPIEPRPFETLARELDAEEADVLARVRALHDAGLVRQIGPVFDLHRLGYTSTLCAAKIAPEAVDTAAARINAYPEVTHNYLRDAQFNMWFTLVAPSQNRIDEILKEIRRVGGIDEVLSLPAENTFKINVHFRKTGTATPFSSSKGVAVPAFRNRDSHHLFSRTRQINGDCPHLDHLDDRDIAVIRALQDPLPLVERPYAELAERAAVTEDELVARIRAWLDSGLIRRFGARVKHRAIGYTANGMSVWDVAPDQTEAAGNYMASLPQVSHCYTRTRAENWPYNLYAMIHAQKEEEVLETVQQIAARLNISNSKILFSTRELKKSAPKFF